MCSQPATPINSAAPIPHNTNKIRLIHIQTHKNTRAHRSAHPPTCQREILERLLQIYLPASSPRAPLLAVLLQIAAAAAPATNTRRDERLLFVEGINHPNPVPFTVPSTHPHPPIASNQHRPTHLLRQDLDVVGVQPMVHRQLLYRLLQLCLLLRGQPRGGAPVAFDVRVSG